MANKDYKAFIVEGEVREPQVIDNISKIFFSHKNYYLLLAISILYYYFLILSNL